MQRPSRNGAERCAALRAPRPALLLHRAVWAEMSPGLSPLLEDKPQAIESSQRCLRAWPHRPPESSCISWLCCSGRCALRALAHPECVLQMRDHLVAGVFSAAWCPRPPSRRTSLSICGYWLLARQIAGRNAGFMLLQESTHQLHFMLSWPSGRLRAVRTSALGEVIGPHVLLLRSSRCRRTECLIRMLAARVNLVDRTGIDFAPCGGRTGKCRRHWMRS